MTWECGPGPGDGRKGPESGPRIAAAILIFIVFMGLMAYCGTKGG